MIHGQLDTAEMSLREIEETVAQEAGEPLEPPPQDRKIEVQERHSFGLAAILKPMVTTLRRRPFLGFH